MNSLNIQKNIFDKSKKILINVNLDLLFDFKSILIAITRYFQENSAKFEINNLRKMNHFNGNFFKTIELKNIEQFVNDVVERVEVNNDLQSSDNENFDVEVFKKEMTSELKEKIYSCKEFECVKPRLFFLFRFYYVIMLIKQKFSNEDIQINISSYDTFFVEVINKLNTLTVLENLFDLKKNSICLNVDNNIQQNSGIVNSKEIENSVNVRFDNRQISMDETEQNSIKDSCDKNIFYFFPNSIMKNSEKGTDNLENYQHSYEKFIENISKKLDITSELSQLEKYKDVLDNEFIQKYSKKYLTHEYKFLKLWRNYLNFKEGEIITIEGKVIPGFKRGSKLLGVPTANIQIIGENSVNVLKSLLNGVYFGKYQFIKSNDETVYKSVLSIGYNPYFDNSFKTLEIFLIDYEGEDFYDSEGRLSIEGFVRNESAFENFSELVTAINYDIIVSYFK